MIPTSLEGKEQKNHRSKSRSWQSRRVSKIYLVLSDESLTVPDNERDANENDEEQSKTLWALQVIGRVAVPPFAAAAATH